MPKQHEVCETCYRPITTQRRHLRVAFVRVLLRLARQDGDGFVHHTEIAARVPTARDFTILANSPWGLIEPSDKVNGLWRITERGQRFVAHELAVPRYLEFRLSRVLAEGPPIYVAAALGEFRYEGPQRWNEYLKTSYWS